MDNAHTAKEPVTIRLGAEVKNRLLEVGKTSRRTVSSLIETAVLEFLERQGAGAGLARPLGKLRIRHAPLPDTSVFEAFYKSDHARALKVLKELNLPDLEFVGERPSWRRLPADLFTGESDLVESVNFSAIFSHINRGGDSPRMDWKGPFLQLFVGHCMFIGRDHFHSHFRDQGDVADFERFHQAGETGKDRSLRTMIAWVNQSHPAEVRDRRRAKLYDAWFDAVVVCELGTDFHLCARRVSAIVARMAKKDDGEYIEPTYQNGSLAEFRTGMVSAFTSNLLDTSTLLADQDLGAVLVAGPADLRIPSLNVLAGQKGMFSSPMGDRVLALWALAVRWFRDEVVHGRTDEEFRKYVAVHFPDFRPENGAAVGGDLTPLAILRSLMQTWVRWFPDAEAVGDFLGQGGPIEAASGITTADLVQYYENLCDLLNPTAQMVAPNPEENLKERAFWKFPTLRESSYRPSASEEKGNGSKTHEKTTRRQKSARRQTGAGS